MGFGLILAGLVLLFNPMIHVIDIIPDIIGFLLIVKGLSKMSFFIGKMEEAKRAFSKLFIIEGLKLFSIVFIPFGSLVPHQLGSTLVLLTFVFALLEVIFFIPAVNALFEGIDFVGIAYNGTLVYDKGTKKHIAIEAYIKKVDGKPKRRFRIVRMERKIEYSAKTKRLILSFFIFRNIMTLIPELTELDMYQFIGNVSANSHPMTFYKPLLYAVSVICVLVFGIIYIVKTSSFFRCLRRDKPFIEGLRAKYETDILPKKTMFLSIGMKNAIYLMMFAVLMSFVFYIENINIFVGVFSAVSLILVAVRLKDYKLALCSIPFSVVRAILSVVNAVSEYRYFSEYEAKAADYFDRAYEMFYQLAWLEGAEDVISLVSFILLTVALIRAVKAHLPLCGMQIESAQYSKMGRDRELYGQLKTKFIISIVLTVLNFAMAAAYLPLLVKTDAVIAIAPLVTLVWAIYTVYTLSLVNSNIYSKEIESI